jgi:hypothetical protein
MNVVCVSIIQPFRFKATCMTAQPLTKLQHDGATNHSYRLITHLNRGTQIFQKSRRHLKISGYQNDDMKDFSPHYGHPDVRCHGTKFIRLDDLAPRGLFTTTLKNISLYCDTNLPVADCVVIARCEVIQCDIHRSTTPYYDLMFFWPCIIE